MQWIRAVVVVLASLAGCSENTGDPPIPYGCGGANTAPCPPGQVCVDGCQPCGGQGQYCCDPSVETSGASRCNDALAQCVPYWGYEVWHCDNTCGSLGLPCCQTYDGPDCGVDHIDENQVAHAVDCDLATNVCVYSDACAGETPHFVELIGTDHCLIQGDNRFELESDTPEACVAAQLAMNYPDGTVTAGPLDVEAAVDGDYCDGTVGYHLRAMTAADLALCQQALCGAPECSWTASATCPL